jgi:hypothetical protein
VPGWEEVADFVAHWLAQLENKPKQKLIHASEGAVLPHCHDLQTRIGMVKEEKQPVHKPGARS